MSKTYCEKLFKAIDNKNYKCGDYIQNLIVYGIGAQYAQCDDCRRLDSSISHAKQSILAEVATMIAAANPEAKKEETIQICPEALGELHAALSEVVLFLRELRSEWWVVDNKLDSLRLDLEKQHAEILGLVKTLVRGG